MLVLFEGDNGVNETFRHVEKLLGGGCWIWDLQTDRMEWSPGFCDLLGVERGTMAASMAALKQLIHPDDRPPQAEIERVIREASSIRRKFRVIQPSGKIVWIFCQITVLVNPEGASVKAIGVAQDVTKYQDSLSPLRIYEERYRALIKAMGALVWIAKADGVVYEYPNWSDFQAEPPSPSMYARWTDFVHPDDRQRTEDAWSEAQRQKQGYFIEHRIWQLDGSYAWRRTNCAPILDVSGNIQEWIGINSDIQRAKLALSPGSGRLTGAQIRAARGLLKWSAEELADASGTTRATIRRLEETDGPFVTAELALRAVEEALTGGGVEFLYPEIGKPGVRPR